MNKNGFIATSLIYSFFLIFITLFLTIIADYLQDKVLLSTIEKGIKDEINSTMGITDFEVGDMISFVSDCAPDSISNPGNQWVVANVNYINKKVIFYSYDFNGNIGPDGFKSTTPLTKNDIDNDIEFGYRNSTYFNKILYTFQNKKVEADGSVTEIKEYSLGTDCVSIDCDGTSTGDYDSGKNCIRTCISSSPSSRKRLEVNVVDTKYNKCVNDSVVIILEV